MTPACRNIASTAACGARVCSTLCPTGTPCVVRPDFTATTGLRTTDPACDAGELARVTDRLQVEQHDLGRLVLLPVLEQVVAGDVGAVSGRHERRQAQAATLDVLQDRHAERAGLAEEPDPTARRDHRRQGRVERDVAVGVDHAEAVRPDQSQPVRPGQADQSTLPPAALVTGLGEAAGDDDQAVDALRGAVEHDVLHGVGGHRDDRQVDLVGDLPHRRVRRHARDSVGRGVHDVDPTGVPAKDEVADQRRADGVLAAAGADDRDALGDEEPLHRPRLGAVLARPHHADRGVGRLDRELQLHHAVGEPTRDLVAGVAEGLDHPSVVGQRLGDELADPALASGLREVLEEELREPSALVRILDEEGDLGLSGVESVVPADGDDVAAHRHDERGPVHVVHVCEALDVARRQLRIWGEEAQVLGLRRDPRIERDKTLRVFGRDRAQSRRAPVQQEHIGFPVGRVVGVVVAVVSHERNLSGRCTSAPLRQHLADLTTIRLAQCGTSREPHPRALGGALVLELQLSWRAAGRLAAPVTWDHLVWPVRTMKLRT